MTEPKQPSKYSKKSLQNEIYQLISCRTNKQEALKKLVDSYISNADSFQANAERLFTTIKMIEQDTNTIRYLRNYIE